jgi:hypothetical protein
MRKEFHLKKSDLKKLYEASRPVPYILVGGVEPTSTQERANEAWKVIAKKYGFIWDTAQPVPGKGPEFVSAEVSK